jgi:hypothetical protein
MPAINIIKCDSCGLAFPSGWGHYCYATDQKGQRIICGHPGEARVAKEVTGLDWAAARAVGLLGLQSYCLCFDCLAQVELDLDKDIKRCPKCQSLNVKSANGAIASRRPKCKNGVFREESTGMFS